MGPKGCPKTSEQITNLRRVTIQTGKDLIYTRRKPQTVKFYLLVSLNEQFNSIKTHGMNNVKMSQRARSCGVGNNKGLPQVNAVAYIVLHASLKTPERFYAYPSDNTTYLCLWYTNCR
jgi:hypothetical protein